MLKIYFATNKVVVVFSGSTELRLLQDRSISLSNFAKHSLGCEGPSGTTVIVLVMNVQILPLSDYFIFQIPLSLSRFAAMD